MAGAAGTRAGHAALIEDLTRRGFLRRTSVLGLSALVASAVPFTERVLDPPPALADVNLLDATLQAFADTILPGRKATTTDLGHAIHPLAIAGVDPQPGAVETDALALFHHPLIGFDALEPALLADLSTRSLLLGADFLHLPFDKRVGVLVAGLAFDNPSRAVWEAAAAVPFTAFCAAALVRNATAATASGYQVMGLPGIAPNGYRAFSYGKKLARERTKHGYLG
ncbi:MAG TPA: DUF5987 family protein [Solirubrobacteraceae bacterium]|jgi:hypothetical protein|nr:DUF5987 family protein [Solirubrobacteraceae bacterium]